MKMVKNIAIVALTTTFMFAGIGFHMATNYSTLQADDVTVGNSYGVTYGLSSTASVGYDSKLGMIMFFAAPAGATLRLGWTPPTGLGDGSDANNLATSTSLGMGYTWWQGGEGLKTSLTTNFDYVMAPGSTDEAVQATNTTNLSMVVGFGF